MIDINTTGIALTRTSRLLRPQYCLLCPHAHRFAFVFLAWDFPQVTQTSATLTPARSTASSWQYYGMLPSGPSELHNLFDKVVSVGTSPGPNSSDHNVNTITNGDGILHSHTPTIPTSAVRNTEGRSGPQGLEEPTSDEVLRELCDKNYHQLLPLIAEKIQKEKEQQDKLNAVKARLLYGNETEKNRRNHEESHYSESKTPTARTEPKRRHGNRRSRSLSPVASVFKRLKQNRPHSPRPRPRKEGGVFNRLGGKERSASARSDSRHQGSHEKEIEVQPRKHHHRGTSSQETGGHSLGHVRKETLSHLAAAKTDRWAMPTWCHMFNSTLTGNARVWFDKFPRESIDSEDLRTAFRENYLQQTKHIKDLVEIHHIKQKDGESTEDFMERYKAEILDVEGAPECMKISGFMHDITHPEPIKRLYEKIPRSMDEMYRVTTSFLQGEVAAFTEEADRRDDRKLSQFIKELKQSDKPKAQKKGETTGKEKP
ncbi:reverse transcriptase domain-containing protein [Tanacetum coccineum]